MFWQILGIGAIVFWWKMKPYKATPYFKHEHFTNLEQGISLRAEKNKGRLLSQSGHPDEYINERQCTMSLADIQKRASNKTEASAFALNGGYYNQNAIFERTAFKSPSDEIHQPMPDVRSAWYQNARHHVKAMLARVVPHSVY